MPSRVSVVIPYYNNSRTIHASVNSVLEQTVAADEILVIDDCSSPESAVVLDSLSSRVKVLRTPVNGGVGAARAFGSIQASSTWVAYQDADDIWLPTKLEAQLRYLAANPELDGAHCGTIVWRNGVDTAVYVNKPARLTPVNVCEGENILPPAFIVKRDRLLEIGNWAVRRDILADWDLSFRMMKAGLQIGFVPEALIRVRRDGHASLTSDLWRELLVHLSCLSAHADFIVETTSPATLEDMRAACLYRFGRRRGRLAGRLVAWGAGMWRRAQRP
jgi:glycosyltransferase involved in cell wall biosynthesis